ncbi:hypothetical protein AB3X91_16140 [Paraburkholderia sp. BR14263]|uniref:hypothetical protein n=1 Tax=unclassified Paraburkholderia TaxID=2615204 RepID=UPI0034CEC1EF
MEICFSVDGQKHCWWIPDLELPISHFKPGGPIDYPAFLNDAVILASLRGASSKINDPAVRERLTDGFNEALDAMSQHAGPGFELKA